MDFFDKFNDLLSKAPSWDNYDSGPHGYPQSVNDVRQFFQSYIVPPLRSYIEVLKQELYKKYDLSQDTDPLTITTQYLSIDEERKALKDVFKFKENDPTAIPDPVVPNEGFELYKKYWNANRALRLKTPNFPPRDTTGTGDLTDPIVFGRRNLNLFAPYGTFPGENDPKGLALKVSVPKTPNQINNNTIQDKTTRQEIRNGKIVTTTFTKVATPGVTTVTHL